MCHEFLTHPLLVFSLFRLWFSAFFGFGFQPFSALLSAFFGFGFQPFVDCTHLILQTARSNTQSGSQCSEYADRDLQNCFPSFFLHFV